jgi:hypothetical protein
MGRRGTSRCWEGMGRDVGMRMDMHEGMGSRSRSDRKDVEVGIEFEEGD